MRTRCLFFGRRVSHAIYTIDRSLVPEVHRYMWSKQDAKPCSRAQGKYFHTRHGPDRDALRPPFHGYRSHMLSKTLIMRVTMANDRVAYDIRLLSCINSRQSARRVEGASECAANPGSNKNKVWHETGDRGLRVPALVVRPDQSANCNLDTHLFHSTTTRGRSSPGPTQNHWRNA